MSSTSKYHRHSIRLKGYDYSQEGLYFVTICCQYRECLFGEIVNNKMILSDAGNIVNDCWQEIPNHFPNVYLHEYVIMPNHIHVIVEIVVGARSARPNIDTETGQANPAPTKMPTLGNIIGYFKYQTTKQINLSNKIWQRNYYEHIIRNEQSFQRIVEYIIDNPTKWNEDKFYNS